MHRIANELWSTELISAFTSNSSQTASSLLQFSDNWPSSSCFPTSNSASLPTKAVIFASADSSLPSASRTRTPASLSSWGARNVRLNRACIPESSNRTSEGVCNSVQSNMEPPGTNVPASRKSLGSRALPSLISERLDCCRRETWSAATSSSSQSDLSRTAPPSISKLSSRAVGVSTVTLTKRRSPKSPHISSTLLVSCSESALKRARAVSWSSKHRRTRSFCTVKQLICSSTRSCVSTSGTSALRFAAAISLVSRSCCVRRICTSDCLESCSLNSRSRSCAASSASLASAATPSFHLAIVLLLDDRLPPPHSFC
mmetsp:Transcript_98046/g.224867  ORF Transcript_98046/g.224867 Transcript_98046/m.224867 type:complete len:315 (+) Transcript_98046:929-1873(+)